MNDPFIFFSAQRNVGFAFFSSQIRTKNLRRTCRSGNAFIPSLFFLVQSNREFDVDTWYGSAIKRLKLTLQKLPLCFLNIFLESLTIRAFS